MSNNFYYADTTPDDITVKILDINDPSLAQVLAYKTPPHKSFYHDIIRSLLKCKNYQGQSWEGLTDSTSGLADIRKEFLFADFPN